MQEDVSMLTLPNQIKILFCEEILRVGTENRTSQDNVSFTIL